MLLHTGNKLYGIHFFEAACIRASSIIILSTSTDDMKLTAFVNRNPFFLEEPCGRNPFFLEEPYGIRSHGEVINNITSIETNAHGA